MSGRDAGDDGTDEPQPGDGLKYWQRVGTLAFPRRTAELQAWAQGSESSWLVEVVRRRLAGGRDTPLDGSELVNEAFLDLLDRLQIGVGVLDTANRVYFSNRVLRELIDGEATLAIRDERPPAKQAATVASLAARPGGARGEAEAAGAGVLVCHGDFAEALAETMGVVLALQAGEPGRALRLNGATPLLLYVTPAITPSPGQATAGPLVCLFAARADSRAPINAADVAHWFGLTSAEAELATCFAYGESLQAYADRRELSLNTVRNQFAAAKAKLNADSQADVVRRILLGNPLAAFSHQTAPPA